MKFGAVLCLLPGWLGSAAMAQTSVAGGVYTEAEAQRGQAAYASKCASCHGRDLNSKGDAPGLVGEPFTFGWKGQTLGERFARIKESMPPNDAGNLADQMVVDVMAYVLKVNGYPPGAAALPTEAAKLEQIVIPK